MRHTHTHAQIPDYLKIDYDEPLLGSVKSYGRHVLFQTGPGRTPRNWPTKLEEEEASLAMEVGHARTQPHQTHAHPPTLGGRTHCMSGWVWGFGGGWVGVGSDGKRPVLGDRGP
jgi:hypothetical protein